MKVDKISLRGKRKSLPGLLSSFLFLAMLTGCNSGGNVISEIHVGLHNNNELKIRLDVLTTRPVDAFAEYWPDSAGEGGKYVTAVSSASQTHKLILLNIQPHTKYSYHIITVDKGVRSTSKTYTFESHNLPMYLQEQFKYNCDSLSFLPPVFKSGFMLVNKRETPGVVYLVDYLGRIRWYHMVDGVGYKVAHFTKEKTIISILGKNDEPTSYGSQILETNLFGDTLLYLKKGEGDLKSTIHHEIIKNNNDQIITLFVDKRIMDLSKLGGSKQDTINGDGILVLDRKGRKVWQWSVFDVVDPLKDPKLLKNKKDWMHANSLNFDTDSNYIISFYNNGQIWKVDSHTGKVLWKFGKGGDVSMPAECSFSQAHAVHINHQGSLMFYDNGVENRQSEVFALKLDEQKNRSVIDIHIKLPREVYNDRMGSAYMVNDTAVLCCSSKRHIVVLSNRKGVLFWTMDTAIPPYRVEFLKQEQLDPFLQPINVK